jgi:preprotein translocase subunit SecB
MAKALKKHQKASAAKAPTEVSVTIFERLQLRNIRLISLVSNLQIHNGKLPTVASLESTASVGPAPDGNLHVNMTLTLTGRPSDAAADDDASLVKIEVHYQCIYEVVEGGPEQFEKDASIIAKVGMLVLWPHIRELVQSVTSRMAIPPFILPIFAPGGKGDGTVTLTESKADTKRATKRAKR